jgi:hypothetical protein
VRHGACADSAVAQPRDHSSTVDGGEDAENLANERDTNVDGRSPSGLSRKRGEQPPEHIQWRREHAVGSNHGDELRARSPARAPQQVGRRSSWRGGRSRARRARLGRRGSRGRGSASSKQESPVLIASQQSTKSWRDGRERARSASDWIWDPGICARSAQIPQIRIVEVVSSRPLPTLINHE